MQLGFKKKMIMRNMQSAFFIFVLLFIVEFSYQQLDGSIYDSTAYTECQFQPEAALYGGGMMKYEKNPTRKMTFKLFNLTPHTKYSFSIWIKIESGPSTALLRASLMTKTSYLQCIGTVIAKQGCWSFLKGGFELVNGSRTSTLFIQNADGQNITIISANPSLQPFTPEQWRANQDRLINEVRKRDVIVQVVDSIGNQLPNANISVEQVSNDFPLGAAIDFTIIGNSSYQKWFADRFNVAVFGMELKWLVTEPVQGHVDYTLADEMLEFLRSKGIKVRGHNIVWEIKQGNPFWAWNLTGPALQSAVDSRIQSLMTKYRGEFIHWDVNNEELHYDFFKKNLLSPDPTLEFFKTVNREDPLATLFQNEFNVVEGCTDGATTVDRVISRMRELQLGGALRGGIGLQGHFGVPNPALMRGILDKLATLGLPIWLTEVDISSKFGNSTDGVVKQLQAQYLDVVLREAYSHPAVKGIIIWSAFTPFGPRICYKMCLTNGQFVNYPAGDTVDALLKEWHTGVIDGVTDTKGQFSFSGFLGEYKVTVTNSNGTTSTTFGLSQNAETKHLTMTL